MDLTTTSQSSLPVGRKRVPFLDAVKGLCMLFIILTHFPWTAGERLDYLFPFHIRMAVPILMIVSGYVGAAGVKSLRDSYRAERLLPKLLRFAPPYLAVFALEWVLELGLDAHTALNTHGGAGCAFPVLRRFLEGGLGPGSYYTPMMIQFIFLFPVICAVVKRAPGKGLRWCFLANLAYEVGKNVGGMSRDIYRLLVLRYLFAIAVGVYLAERKEPLSKKKVAAAFAVGVAFVTVTEYTGYREQIFTMWTGTAMLSVLYAAPLFLAGLTAFKEREYRFPVLSFIGRASFNIYLTQMVYYHYFAEAVYRAIPSRAAQPLVNLVICLTIGGLFYKAEAPLTKKLIAAFRTGGKRRGTDTCRTN